MITGLQATGHRMLGRLRGLTPVDIALACLARFTRMNGSERAASIAAKAFITLIPLLIVVSGFLSDSAQGSAANALVSRFGLSGDGAEAVQQLFTTPSGVPRSFTVPAIVLLLFSGVSLVRALQRTWEVAWALPPRGVRGTGWAALATLVLLVNLAILNLVTGLFKGLPANWLLLVPLRFVFAVGFWLAVQYLLLSRRVPWRNLRSASVLIAAGQAGLVVASAVYVPPLINRYAGRYGLIGVTFVLVSWLVVLCLVLVLAAVLSAELQRRKQQPAGPADDDVI